MKHILLVSQYFYPETFRVNDMAVEWVKRGYKVTVLTGIPNYPMGKFFDGYDFKHKRRELWNGVDIIRIPLIPRGNSRNKLINAGGMVINYLSFIASGKWWVTKNNIKADLVFTVEVSPMTQALIGIWYKKRYHVPAYLYVQDLWPENVEIVTGIHNRVIIGSINKMVDKIYKETDEIFTTSPSFVNAIVNRKVPVERKKVHYWPQYAETFYKPIEKRNIDGIPNDDSYKIAFTGNIGTAQGLDILPKAARLLKVENVKFIIVGDGRYQPEFEKKIAEYSVKSKFVMIPRVQAERIPEILSVCNAGFISFNKTPLWEMTIPAKLQSYMACGKAIIASASGETKRIIEAAECGICCDIGNAKALADGIKELMKCDNKEMGEKARKYFDTHFDKKVLMDQIDKLIGGRQPMSIPVIKPKSNRLYQICKCCVMDTTDEDIVFDSNGVCERCNEYKNRILPEWNYGKGHDQELKQLIHDIKESGKGKKYDCILGLSGGLDSSYMLHLAVKEWGLRPFVFHIDAGWNLPVAEKNIKRLTNKLGVKLHIKKMDWNEMREMQLAWFRTGLEMLDAPQDHAFISLIDKYSKQLNVKYILNGYNICTEIVADPISWEKGAGPTGDGTYIKDVVKKYCNIPIRNYTYTSGLKHKFWNPYIKGIKTIKPLNLVEFTKESMIKTLGDEYGYVPYGQKHFEDMITKFLEGWWQPTRFGHDIRRAQLSSLVITGQMTRDAALKILEQPPLSEKESKELFIEVAKRLEISEDELMKFHEMPECTEKFRSQEKFYNIGIKIYEKLGLEKRIRK